MEETIPCANGHEWIGWPIVGKRCQCGKTRFVTTYNQVINRDVFTLVNCETLEPVIVTITKNDKL